MSECICLPKCPFFNGRMQEKFSVVLEAQKRRYCLGENAACARYRVFQKLGREAVPADLFPNQVARAREILAQAGR